MRKRQVLQMMVRAPGNAGGVEGWLLHLIAAEERRQGRRGERRCRGA